MNVRNYPELALFMKQGNDYPYSWFLYSSESLGIETEEVRRLLSPIRGREGARTSSLRVKTTSVSVFGIAEAGLFKLGSALYLLLIPLPFRENGSHLMSNSCYNKYNYIQEV